jgi:uncharacterized protein with FMN-binding domain
MIPKRGAIASILTVAGLALLLSFKTPEISNLTTTTGNTAIGGNSGNNVTGVTGNNGSTGNTGSGSNTGSTGNTGSTSGSGTGTTTGSGTRSTYTGQVTGQAIQIPFGTVQVQVTFQNGKITDVQALQMPSDQRHSSEISSYAAPQLRSEVLQAQSAQIDTISGATYTSMGYVQSLQSALDQVPA